MVDQEELSAPEGSPWARGGTQQDARMMAVARLAAENHEGCLVEIGCSRGGTTVGLAKIAREFGRSVITVDPWESDAEYQLFLKNTYEYRDVIDVVRLPSEHQAAIAHIKSHPLCFAYIDGRHTYENCVLDMETVNHAPVICVDDLWSEELIRAFNESPREEVWNASCKEGYIC